MLSGIASRTRPEGVARMNAEKVRENRLRRMAERQGLRLVKARRRDPRALDFGMYALVEERSNAVVAGAASGRFDFSLDDVERYLTGENDG